MASQGPNHSFRRHAYYLHLLSFRNGHDLLMHIIADLEQLAATRGVCRHLRLVDSSRSYVCSILRYSSIPCLGTTHSRSIVVPQGIQRIGLHHSRTQYISMELLAATDVFVGTFILYTNDAHVRYHSPNIPFLASFHFCYHHFCWQGIRVVCFHCRISRSSSWWWWPYFFAGTFVLQIIDMTLLFMVPRCKP